MVAFWLLVIGMAIAAVEAITKPNTKPTAINHESGVIYRAPVETHKVFGDKRVESNEQLSSFSIFGLLIDLGDRRYFRVFAP